MKNPMQHVSERMRSRFTEHMRQRGVFTVYPPSIYGPVVGIVGPGGVAILEADGVWWLWDRYDPEGLTGPRPRLLVKTRSEARAIALVARRGGYKRGSSSYRAQARGMR